MSGKTLARRRAFSAAERAEYRESKQVQAREAIERAARALLTSDGWRRWAETRASFHDYSACNCMLIATQCPEAKQVAGFKAWQQLGRQVRKGEHAIRIMAPMVVKRRDERDEEADETITLFRAVSVFDVSQTDGDPLPARPCEPVTGGSHEPCIVRLAASASTRQRSQRWSATTTAAISSPPSTPSSPAAAPSPERNTRWTTTSSAPHPPRPRAACTSSSPRKAAGQTARRRSFAMSPSMPS